MQKICPNQNCRQLNPSDAGFCHHCATSLANAQIKTSEPQWSQPNNPPPQVAQNYVIQASSMTTNRPMIAAGLAVLSLFCCGFFTGIPGAILGWMEIQSIRRGESSPNGMTMAQIGLWLGIAGSVINAIISVAMFILMSLGGQRGY